MATRTVHFTTTASLSVDVDVPDDLDEAEAREKAIELAYDEAPGGVCAQCSGWGRSFSLDLAEWEAEEGDDNGRIKD